MGVHRNGSGSGRWSATEPRRSRTSRRMSSYRASPKGDRLGEVVGEPHEPVGDGVQAPGQLDPEVVEHARVQVVSTSGSGGLGVGHQTRLRRGQRRAWLAVEAGLGQDGHEFPVGNWQGLSGLRSSSARDDWP